MNVQGFSLRKFATVGAVALMATTLFAASHPASAQEASPVSGDSTASVTVNGVGIITTTPDTASVQLGVTVTQANLADAQSLASTQMQAVNDALIAAGVEEKDIQTSSYYVSVVQNYDESGNPSEVTNFQVQNMVNVVVRDIDAVGPILDSAVEAGANTVYGVNFYLDDSSAASTEARALAVQDAQTRAEELAAAAGMTLGPVVSISEGYSSGPIYGKGGGAMNAEAAGQASIQVGTTTIEVNVTVTYQLI